MDATVAGMLELTRPDIELSIAMEEEHPTPCEAYQSHPVGDWGHVPSQGASYLAGYPCGRTMLYCAGFVESTKPDANIDCLRGTGGCGQKHPWSSVAIVPLTPSN